MYLKNRPISFTYKELLKKINKENQEDLDKQMGSRPFSQIKHKEMEYFGENIPPHYQSKKYTLKQL